MLKILILGIHETPKTRLGWCNKRKRQDEDNTKRKKIRLNKNIDADSPLNTISQAMNDVRVNYQNCPFNGRINSRYLERMQLLDSSMDEVSIFIISKKFIILIKTLFSMQKMLRHSYKKTCDNL